MIKHALALALMTSPTLALAGHEASPDPSPREIVRSAPASEWAVIPPEDLLVMTLPPDAKGKPRQVVIQLMPAPFSQGWVKNIRTLAKAHWWDGLTIYRSVDNWVVQWGDGEEAEEDRRRPAKPLPQGLNVVPESEYTVVEGLFGDLATPQLTSPVTPQAMPDLYVHTGYAGFREGWPYAYDMTSAQWPTHCYASVGVARDLSPDTGTGAELYAVIGHAPRQLDRNIAVVGRVIEGMAHLSILPRGTGEYGVYETEREHTPIVSVRLGDDTGEFPPPRFEYLDTSSESFVRYVNALANREDEFYRVPAGGIDICNIRVPIRRVPSD